MQDQMSEGMNEVLPPEKLCGLLASPAAAAALAVAVTADQLIFTCEVMHTL